MSLKNLSKFNLAIKQYNSIDLEKCRRVSTIVQGILIFESSAQPFMWYDEKSFLEVTASVRDSNLTLLAVGFTQYYIWYSDADPPAKPVAETLDGVHNARP